ncbi:MAG TPA: hypothetical protein VNO55_31615 [Polyangia bacterium]|nr:hypothetical protein [Polyangia bacterium]
MGFSIVGYDDAGEPVYKQTADGSVMGSVMGHQQFGVVGAAHHPHHHRMIHVPPKPEWRGADLAHGVQQPDEGMLPMPLQGSGGTNTFTPTVPVITFQGQMQKPYRAERMIFIVTRLGDSAAGVRVQGQIFVGTDLQQGELGLIDFESLGAPTAFGTRLTLTPASPGVFLRLQCQLVGGALTTDGQILVNTYFLGRVIH